MAITPDVIEVFPWSGALETGIESIDEQHQRLLRLINRLANDLAHGNEMGLPQVFEEVAAYVDYHFASEERIWSKHLKSDDWFHRHREAHRSFLPKVIEIKSVHRHESEIHALERILKFLIRWLAVHIIENDIRLAIVIRKIDEGMSLQAAKDFSDAEMKGSVGLLTNTVLDMYERLASQMIELMRERQERERAEKELVRANRELEKLSITDVLTGLHNRRHFNEVFAKELRRARRGARPLTLIMIDLDYFKQLNDAFGHERGDRALAAVGRKLAQLSRRAGDHCFRLGGEEFAAIITDQREIATERFCEGIREGVEALLIPNPGCDDPGHLTVSVGSISKVPTAADSVDTYIRHADRNLYEAKHQGRNRVKHSAIDD